VTKLDKPMIIDQRGIAFSAKEIVLDKQPMAPEDIAPVAEDRDAGFVSQISYDIPDLASFARDITATGPGVDRLAFLLADPANQPTVVTLKVGQILERKKSKRVLAPIVLDAQRIFMVGGQIVQLLCATWRMRTQQRDRLIRAFKERDDDDERLKENINGDLRDDLYEALAPFLRFDVAPEELIDLQQRGIFALDGKEIIVLHNDDGTETPYYRDHPDSDSRDTLLRCPTTCSRTYRLRHPKWGIFHRSLQQMSNGK
jgi:hypothetical protein